MHSSIEACAAVVAAALFAPSLAGAAPGTYEALAMPTGPHLTRSQVDGACADGHLTGIVSQRRVGQAGFVTGARARGVRLVKDPEVIVTGAWGVNSLGVVVGSAVRVGVGREHAMIAAPDHRTLTDLGTFGGDTSVARGINGAGRVVGFAQRADGNPRAFITAEDGTTLVDLGTLGGRTAQAFAINEDGRVVGYAGVDADETPHAFLTGPDGHGMDDLGTLPGGLWSEATNLNGAAQVVGDADRGHFVRHGFVTGAGGAGMRDVDPARPGVNSGLLAINDHGQAVGHLWPRGREVAGVTNPRGEGLFELTHLTTGLPPGVHLVSATGIDEAGRIVANGSDAHVYVLLPRTAWTPD